MRPLTEAETRRVVDAVLDDPVELAGIHAGEPPRALREIAVDRLAASLRAGGHPLELVELGVARIRTILMHPAAGKFFDEAIALAARLDLSAEQALASLNALAAMTVTRRAN
jgi:hypothetical protein